MTDKARFELWRTINALQDAFAYCGHAELIARCDGDNGARMRLKMLKEQITRAIDHAGILYETGKDGEVHEKTAADAE